jgi:hypothetical protein
MSCGMLYHVLKPSIFLEFLSPKSGIKAFNKVDLPTPVCPAKTVILSLKTC